MLTRRVSGFFVSIGEQRVPLTLAGLLAGMLASHPVAIADSLENSLGMRFIRIPAGSFTMGTVEVEAARMEFPEPGPDDVLDETPAHVVHISEPFYLGETEVTQGVWYRVMQNRPGEVDFWGRDDWEVLPMATASWYMAQRFVEELSTLDRDYRYRLPTEAEWEYAARAGSRGLRPFAATELERHAWFINNSGDEPRPVATREANAFGLYDMLGNVWEWVADWYGAETYATSAATDPQGPDEGFARVRRGGSYDCPIHLVRPG